MTNAVEIRGLRKSSSDLEVLKGIDLDVAEGEAVVLLGSSGAGKSTLLRCINFMEEPTAGQVRVNGNLIGTELGGRCAITKRTCVNCVRESEWFFSISTYSHI